jgi:hypothetical protein
MAIRQFGEGYAARNADIQDCYNRQMRQVQEDMMRNPQQLGNHHPGKLSDWSNPNGYSAEPQQKKPNKVLLLLNR